MKIFQLVVCIKTLRKWMLVTLISIFLVMLALSAVNAQNSDALHKQQAVAQTEQVSSEYPSQSRIVTLSQGYNSNFGLHPLTSNVNQYGSLLWMGYSNFNSNGVSLDSPLVQRIDMADNGKVVISNFAISAHRSKSNGLIGAPLFKGERSSAFFRVFVTDQDYTQYDIYTLNLNSLLAKDTQLSSVLVDDFHVSPSGQILAYTAMPPYESTPYYLMIFEGEQKIVTQNQPIKGFSWTSDNHLLYSAFSDKSDITKNFGYPDIYEDNLRGERKIIKKGAYRPTFNSKKDWLSYMGPDVTLTESQKASKDFRFYPDVIGNMAIFAFDVKKNKEVFVKRIYEKYPDIIWIDDSIYIVENYYSFNKATSYCRVSKFDTKTQAIVELCKLQQKGESSIGEDGKFIPFFRLIGSTNNNGLLMQVPVKRSGHDNYHLISVSIKDGRRTDIFSFSSPPDTTVGYVDWIDQ